MRPKSGHSTTRSYAWGGGALDQRERGATTAIGGWWRVPLLQEALQPRPRHHKRLHAVAYRESHSLGRGRGAAITEVLWAGLGLGRERRGAWEEALGLAGVREAQEREGGRGKGEALAVGRGRGGLRRKGCTSDGRVTEREMTGDIVCCLYSVTSYQAEMGFLWVRPNF